MDDGGKAQKRVLKCSSLGLGVLITSLLRFIKRNNHSKKVPLCSLYIEMYVDDVCMVLLWA